MGNPENPFALAGDLKRHAFAHAAKSVQAGHAK